MTHIEFVDVPFRRWDKHGRLYETRQARRVIRHMGKLMKAGKAVTFTQSQPITPGPRPSKKYQPSASDNKRGKVNVLLPVYEDRTVYDTITVIIED